MKRKAKEEDDDDNIQVISFSYNNGEVPPGDEWTVIDCRSLPNPWKRKDLRDCNGESPLLRSYFQRTGGERVKAIQDAARAAVSAGSKNIAFGCAYGRHRSVAMAALFRDTYLQTTGIKKFFDPNKK